MGTWVQFRSPQLPCFPSPPSSTVPSIIFLLRLAEFPGWVEGLLGAGLGAQGSTSAPIRTVLCKRLISGVVGESVGSTLRLCCRATSLPTTAQPLTSCAPWGHYAASLCLFPICEMGS